MSNTVRGLGLRDRRDQTPGRSDTAAAGTFGLCKPLLGHASIATTERYTAVDDDEMRAAAMTALMT
jgi:integrase